MDILGGADDPLWSSLHAFFTSPLEHRGLILAGASVAVGLVLRWVRRATRS